MNKQSYIDGSCLPQSGPDMHKDGSLNIISLVEKSSSETVEKTF